MDYGSSGSGLSKEDESTVARLAREALKAAGRVREAEAALKQAVADYEKIVKDQLPDLMKTAGVKKLTLANGYDVEVETDIRASITTGEKGTIDNRPAAHAWLRENGFGSLIKTQVIVEFGMGKEKEATKLFESLVKKKQDVSTKESVHSSTLRSFVKERIDEGLPLPESITHTELPVAKISPPKRRA